MNTKTVRRVPRRIKKQIKKIYPVSFHEAYKNPFIVNGVKRDWMHA